MNLFTKQLRVVALATVLVVLAVGCGENDNPCNCDNNGGGNNTGGNGDSYEFVVIGGQKWMKKNLNIETADSWCYENSADSCAKYGRLYTWSAAKSVCPSEWHLSTRADWDNLAEAVGGTKSSEYGIYHDWWNAGKYLKSKTGWTYVSGIENLDTYGFSVLPSGDRRTNGNFSGAGIGGTWWTVTEYDDSNAAYNRNMRYIDDNVIETHGNKAGGRSVRCVRDD